MAPYGNGSGNGSYGNGAGQHGYGNHSGQAGYGNGAGPAGYGNAGSQGEAGYGNGAGPRGYGNGTGGYAEGGRHAEYPDDPASMRFSDGSASSRFAGGSAPPQYPRDPSDPLGGPGPGHPGDPQFGRGSQAPGPGYLEPERDQGGYGDSQLAPIPSSQPQPMGVSLAEAVQAAHAEGFSFGEAVARDAPALWLEAVLARKPRMPSDLEARLVQGSALPIDSLLHDEVRHSLRRGFWDALERSRR
jgi:hypothetical protein